MKRTKPKKRIVLIVLCSVLVLLIGGWWFFSVSIYNDNFNKRFESYEPYTLRVEDFEGLQRTKYEFPSDKGQMLTGYMYNADAEPRGILVIAHGLGAGHNSYMDCANFFAHNGYLVFAYDATGCDESEGDGPAGRRRSRPRHIVCRGKRAFSGPAHRAVRPQLGRLQRVQCVDGSPRSEGGDRMLRLQPLLGSV